ncbi:MAG: hypothetical protein ABIH42_08200 [Planctomycetota bacterium]
MEKFAIFLLALLFIFASSVLVLGLFGDKNETENNKSTIVERPTTKTDTNLEKRIDKLEEYISHTIKSLKEDLAKNPKIIDYKIAKVEKDLSQKFTTMITANKQPQQGDSCIPSQEQNDKIRSISEKVKKIEDSYEKLITEINRSRKEYDSLENYLKEQKTNSKNAILRISDLEKTLKKEIMDLQTLTNKLIKIEEKIADLSEKIEANTSPAATDDSPPSQQMEIEANKMLADVKYFDLVNSGGDKNKSIVKYKEIIEKYPNTKAAQEAKNKIEELTKRK